MSTALALGARSIRWRSAAGVGALVGLLAAGCSSGSVAEPDTTSSVSPAATVGTVTGATSQFQPPSAALAMAETGAPPAASARVTDFGAKTDGSVDVAAALQAAMDSLPPTGGEVVFPAGRYRQDEVIIVDRPGVQLRGEPGATLVATSAERVAVLLRADDTALSTFELQAPQALQRKDALESHRVVIDGAARVRVADNVIDGSPATGVFVFGATDYLVTGNEVRNTLADGIHSTFGARRGAVLGNVVEHPGDDCVAVVSYLADGAVVSNVLEEGNTCRDSYHARGFSVVGGQGIVIRRNTIDSTRAAGVYLASEDSYDTYAAHDVQVVDNVISRANTDPSIDHAAIFSIGRNGAADTGGTSTSLANEDIRLSGNTITDAPASSSFIRFANRFHTRISIVGQSLEGDPSKTALDVASVARDQVEATDNTFNGRPFA